MPLFACEKCETVENTALGAYWGRASQGEPRLCSECATGRWHGQFPKRNAGDGAWLIAPGGLLWREGEAQKVPHLGPFKPYVRKQQSSGEGK